MEVVVGGLSYDEAVSLHDAEVPKYHEQSKLFAKVFRIDAFHTFCCFHSLINLIILSMYVLYILCICVDENS
jgi:hypothetical protein